jgi:hypothetical protein
MKQPRFSVTVTYTDEAKAPGYHAGTWKAVTKWLGQQQDVKDAQFAPAAPVRADEQ